MFEHLLITRKADSLRRYRRIAYGRFDQLEEKARSHFGCVMRHTLCSEDFALIFSQIDQDP